MHYERIGQACIDFMNINIMQFRQHCARADNKTLISIIICHKSKVFVEVNGPLSSVRLYNKFY